MKITPEKNSNYAPVIVFAYNRSEHVKKTIESLKNNYLADKTDIIIYCDGAKTIEDQTKIKKTRDYINSVSGFGSIKIIESKTNKGLASSIIDGVTEVISLKGKAIVLEDDLVSSPYFLTYMNDALNFYEDKSNVWHISGWNYPLDMSDIGDAYFLRVMNCWGWATWADRWKKYEKNPKKIINEFSEYEISRFNLDGVADFWSQVLMNIDGRINTWAVFWYATIFKNGGLCLNPGNSYIENIGHDGTGTHGSLSGNIYSSQLCLKSYCDFPVQISESNLAIARIKRYLKSIKPSIAERIKFKLYRIIKTRKLT